MRPAPPHCIESPSEMRVTLHFIVCRRRLVRRGSILERSALQAAERASAIATRKCQSWLVQ